MKMMTKATKIQIPLVPMATLTSWNFAQNPEVGDAIVDEDVLDPLPITYHRITYYLDIGTITLKPVIIIAVDVRYTNANIRPYDPANSAPGSGIGAVCCRFYIIRTFGCAFHLFIL